MDLHVTSKIAAEMNIWKMAQASIFDTMAFDP